MNTKANLVSLMATLMAMAGLSCDRKASTDENPVNKSGLGATTQKASPSAAADVIPSDVVAFAQEFEDKHIVFEGDSVYIIRALGNGIRTIVEVKNGTFSRKLSRVQPSEVDKLNGISEIFIYYYDCVSASRLGDEPLVVSRSRHRTWSDWSQKMAIDVGIPVLGRAMVIHRRDGKLKLLQGDAIQIGEISKKDIPPKAASGI